MESKIKKSQAQFLTQLEEEKKKKYEDHKAQAMAQFEALREMGLDMSMSLFRTDTPG